MPRKISMDLEKLSVSSFATETVSTAHGTVMANAKGPACPWSQPLSCQATLHTCTDI